MNGPNGWPLASSALSTIKHSDPKSEKKNPFKISASLFVCLFQWSPGSRTCTQILQASKNKYFVGNHSLSHLICVVTNKLSVQNVCLFINKCLYLKTFVKDNIFEFLDDIQMQWINVYGRFAFASRIFGSLTNFNGISPFIPMLTSNYSQLAQTKICEIMCWKQLAIF